jgi:hypothetical protein
MNHRCNTLKRKLIDSDTPDILPFYSQVARIKLLLFSFAPRPTYICKSMHNFVFQLSTCHICLFSKIGPKILKRLRVACNLAIIGPQPVVLQYQTMYLAN